MVVSIAGHSEGFLAVRFPFDQEVVDAMPTVPGRRWSAGGQAWLIPNGRAEGERLSMPFMIRACSAFSIQATRAATILSTRRCKLSGEPSNPAIIAPGRFRHTPNGSDAFSTRTRAESSPPSAKKRLRRWWRTLPWLNTAASPDTGKGGRPPEISRTEGWPVSKCLSVSSFVALYGKGAYTNDYPRFE